MFLAVDLYTEAFRTFVNAGRYYPRQGSINVDFNAFISRQGAKTLSFIFALRALRLGERILKVVSTYDTQEFLCPVIPVLRRR